MVMRMAFKSADYTGAIAVYLIFLAFATLTMAILIFMDALSVFLHALRLHWYAIKLLFILLRLDEGRFLGSNFKANSIPAWVTALSHSLSKRSWHWPNNKTTSENKTETLEALFVGG